MMRSQKRCATSDRFSCSGFTLIELMVVIAIIGILASIAVPNYMRYRRKAEISEIASNLKNFKTGFIAFAIEEGDFPDDCHTDYGPYGLPDKIDGVTVTGIEDYIMVHEWVTPTALGGRYNWEGPDGYWDDAGYFGISIDGATAPQKELEFLDAMVDDGDLTTGYFRLTPNGRYTYMIEHQLD